MVRPPTRIGRRRHFELAVLDLPFSPSAGQPLSTRHSLATIDGYPAVDSLRWISPTPTLTQPDASHQDPNTSPHHHPNTSPHHRAFHRHPRIHPKTATAPVDGSPPLPTSPTESIYTNLPSLTHIRSQSASVSALSLPNCCSTFSQRAFGLL